MRFSPRGSALAVPTPGQSARGGSLHAARTQRRSLRRPPAARPPGQSSVPASAVPAAAACAPPRGEERTRGRDCTGGGRGRPCGCLRFHRPIRGPPRSTSREAPPTAPTTPSPPPAPCAARRPGSRLRQETGPRRCGWRETLGLSAGPTRGLSTGLLDR